MKLIIVLSIWAAIAAVICYFNARYWKLHPDQECNEYEAKKAEGKPCINPTKQDSKHIGRIFFWAAFITIVVFILCS